MISYELAKQLKDAGFSQNTDKEAKYYPVTGENFKFDKQVLNYHDLGCLEDMGVENLRNKSLYIPTLSELIEACGEDFRMLVYLHNQDTGSKWWRAKSHKIGATDCQYEDSEYICANGKSPEEAVANLWLKLNKRG